MSLFYVQMAAAVLLDLLFGDPRFLPHPIRLIGWFCSTSEAFWRRLPFSETLGGFFTVLSVLFLSLGSAVLFMVAADSLSIVAGQVATVFLLYTSFAARSLVDHSRAVYEALQDRENLGSARRAVARIVGRDTAALDRNGIIRATVETIAENMVDGVTAPVFYAIVFSGLSLFTGWDPLQLAALGAIGYKSVNTMDSMFGYKNERYLKFGCCAAKLDDIVNLLPARISGLSLVPAAFFLDLNWKNSLKIFRRDRLNHSSPNAAHPEAAVAGALGIQIGGISFYFGKKMIKAGIGDSIRRVEEKDILRTNSLMLLGSFFFLLVMLSLRFLVQNTLS